jgi:hypothetical protein
MVRRSSSLRPPRSGGLCAASARLSWPPCHGTTTSADLLKQFAEIATKGLGSGPDTYSIVNVYSTGTVYYRLLLQKISCS